MQSKERRAQAINKLSRRLRNTMADADEPIGNLMEKTVREKSGRRMGVQRMRSGTHASI